MLPGIAGAAMACPGSRTDTAGKNRVSRFQSSQMPDNTHAAEDFVPRPDAPDLDAADVDTAVAQLAAARHDWRVAHHRNEEPGPRELPSPERVGRIVSAVRGLLFPMRLGPSDLRQENENTYIRQTLEEMSRDLLQQIRLELDWAHRYLEPGSAPPPARAKPILTEFIAGLGQIGRLLDSDVVAAFRVDPAARSVDEVLLSYPGLRALISHRFAHRLFGLGVPLIARLIAEQAHGETGIDIHPGARIGEGFFIDHGTGVVIGATAIIGRRVRLFEGVTLGAKSFPIDTEGKTIKGLPRHPIIEDDVVIYFGATVLGRITIGAGSVLGGSVWVTEDVPPGTLVSQGQSRRDGGARLVQTKSA